MKLILFYLCLFVFSQLIVSDISFKSASYDLSDRQGVPYLFYILPSIFKNMGLDIIMKKIFDISEQVTRLLFPPPVLPVIPQDVWWGDNNDHRLDNSIKQFYTTFDKERIRILLHKLKYRANFTEPLQGAAMTYGINTNFLNQILDYWLYKYDFEKREQRLNKYPQFKTNIQGLDIHFIHIKPKAKGKEIIPILLLHGWPLANNEFFHVIQALIVPRSNFTFVFEIVAPTIPGFGYSQSTSKMGLAPYQIGIIFKNLMNRLGIKRFYIHGGDFGEQIGSDMAVIYPNDILGFHTTLPFSLRPETVVKYILGAIYPAAIVQPRYTERMYPLNARAYYYITKTGYFHLHGTLPDNIGVSLSDSPSGLAAWILNIWSFATNPNNIFHDDGNLFKKFKIDDLLDVLTIMWDSQSITTSMRIYAEWTAIFQNPTSLKIVMTPTKVPYAAMKFRHEIIYQPDNFLRDKYLKLVHSTTLDFGGHFAAMENPRHLVTDIWKSIKKMKL